MRKATSDLLYKRLAKPWTLTLFPTRGESIVEGFSTVNEYADFLIGASLTDYAKLVEDQRVIKDLMDASDTVRLRTYDRRTGQLCDLEIEIGGNGIHNVVDSCGGTHNVPDGKVFTSPNTTRLQGKVVLDVPVIYNGAEMEGVYLEIKNGRIVDYRAERGQDTLTKIIETDDGSHMMGEIAVGTNPNVTRAMKHPLFAEKIGGTCHMAIGRPYEDCYPELKHATDAEKEERIPQLVAAGRFHKSAQHVDIPTDFRNPTHGQALYIGDTELKWNGTDGKWNPV
ncbi:MAG: aminopeptidase [Candidatus Woesearchaeota archaeon]